MVKKGLGNGLDALFGGKPVLDDMKGRGGESDRNEAEQIQLLAVDKIQPNPNQPRRSFDEEKLAELAASLKEQGVLQPLLVRPQAKGWQIVAGERRYRAAKIAGLKQIPCIVRDLDDNTTLEIALIENIQRQNLNPLEEAQTYHELMENFGYTQQQLGERLGKSRVHIANTMRLLGLPKAIRQSIADGLLSAGHGRAILQLNREADRIQLAEKIIAEGLSVRQAEKLAKSPSLLHGGKTPKTSVSAKSGDLLLNEIGRRLRDKLGTRVQVQKTGAKQGKIQIEYYSDEDLQRLIEILLPGEEF